jgi:hypothetical protein
MVAACPRYRALVSIHQSLRSFCYFARLSPVTFLASTNKRDPIVSPADWDASKLLSNRTRFSSNRKAIIPPSARKWDVAPTVRTGASFSSDYALTIFAVPANTRGRSKTSDVAEFLIRAFDIRFIPSGPRGRSGLPASPLASFLFRTTTNIQQRRCAGSGLERGRGPTQTGTNRRLEHHRGLASFRSTFWVCLVV